MLLFQFRDNKLKALPDSLQNLQNLTSVLLPYNQFETVPAILSELKQLRELNLSHNQIKGDVRIESSTLEQLDLGYNEIRGFDMPRNTSLIKLNLSHNQLEELPLSFRSWSKLQDLNVNQNRLVSLFPAIRDSTSTVTLASLVRLDAGNNYITSMVEGNQGQVLMPKLIELSLMTNKLDDSGLEGLKDTPYLQTLDISSNQLKNIPLLLTDLEQLERLDIRGNQLHTLPYELGKLTRLKAIQCEGNPMRSFTSMSQTQLIESLRGSYAQQESEEQEGEAVKKEQDMDITVEELSRQLTQKVNLSERLDLSHKELTNIPSEYLEFKQEVPGTLLLNHNQFITFPIIPLTKISDFIVTLVLDHNRLTSFNLSLEGVVFAHLKTLKLNNNRIKSLECNPNTASFPRLEELSLNYNALTTLSDDLPKVLPSLKILLASSNKLDNLTDACFGQGLEILDISNNDIGYLPPGLSRIQSLKELVVFGNRFRVPRPAVVEQGTKTILEFLKRRYQASNE
ncbi:uncharacterized protein B0P05DRAFT_463071 [Gilbertella persicaria]|uniref:uncharacterized protein n=1 Tax=Gilbertella persicaria TaxID=101096 RepID=UPI00221F9BEB|nr:uncharacterized protein B0P05DRAFT_463071 [Gilbertella persicaria]KAI8091237.1 hypothetical protein B0P05DRAFT_463071 [Gilbertella persicaria]